MRTSVIGLGISIAMAAWASPAEAEETGFKLLIDKDLSGWKTEKGESLNGKLEAHSRRFTVRDGILHIDPAVKGDVKSSQIVSSPGMFI